MFVLVKNKFSESFGKFSKKKKKKKKKKDLGEVLL